MKIVIIEKCPKTREALCELLLEDGFDHLEAFAEIDEAITRAHWSDADMLLTSILPEAAPDDPVVQWVKRFYPHITSVGHSIRNSGVISYAPIP